MVLLTACVSGGLAGLAGVGEVAGLQLRLQSSGAIDLPYQFFLMLPFVVTILAMALFSRRARAPAALLIPFRREER